MIHQPWIVWYPLVGTIMSFSKVTKNRIDKGDRRTKNSIRSSNMLLMYDIYIYAFRLGKKWTFILVVQGYL